MNSESIVRRPAAALGRLALLAGGLAAAAAPAAAQQPADPRVGLRAGLHDAGQAIRNLELVSTRPRPEGLFDAADVGNFAFMNSDLAFRGNLLFQGNFSGWQVWDISNPAAPTLRSKLVCPGGQGDVSVHGNLLFMSVEMTNGRLDCGGQGVEGASSPDRFRGVRIFDISNLDAPKQVAAVQTCRGSHTHTLVPDPKDASHVYVYVSGTSGVRSAEELAGCVGSPEDPNTALFRIEVIRVPLSAPQQARIVSTPRVFADRQTGAAAGLWRGGTHGEGTQNTAQTNMCHDLTVYPELGLAAGACSGNGILLDIRDPANPVRVDEVIDPNFAYWHSATFNNAGTTILFTDEWGGGTQPRCRDTDKPEWGADAIFTLSNRKLTHAGYFKIPAAQTPQENCVAHNGSLIPVPGRDIMAQAWYQGGLSVVDFSNPAKPMEIAFFDRGPVDPASMKMGGQWGTYWYNGYIYGSEIARGLDVFALKPSEHLSQNEIDAAKLVRVDVANPQLQTKIVWPAAFVVARAYVDQLERGQGLPVGRISAVRGELQRAERLSGAQRRTVLTQLAEAIDSSAQASRDAARVRMLSGAVRDLAGAAR